MKTLLSAYQIDPTRGSEWAISWTWLLDHARLGHEVTCLTSVWGEENRRNVEEGLERLDLPNVSVEFVDLPGPLRGWGHTRTTMGLYLRYLLWQRIAAGVAKRLDTRRGFDLVHHVSWGSLQMGTEMWRLGRPLLFGPVGGGKWRRRLSVSTSARTGGRSSSAASLAGRYAPCRRATAGCSATRTGFWL